ncbi:hypothetical protein JW964_11060 [candidate division KSB1 bacterium]|nr:hypothetical protein [candidate division KSB1 bacterium]
MKRFTKKLLAKYVQYIEFIGYFFVLLFIAGLTALSFIKAEDEFVQLTGELEMQIFVPEITLPLYLTQSLTDSVIKVQSGDTIFTFSNHEKMLQDQMLLQNLTQQIEKLTPESDNEIIMRLNEIIGKIKARKYADVEKCHIISPIQGEFFNFIHSTPQLIEQRPLGGVFDFQNARIVVKQLPVDKQMVRKLKAGQSGTANLNFNSGNSVQVSVTLMEINENQAILKINSFPPLEQKKFALEFCKEPPKTNLSANISVLVGWKSWMRLIWR